MIIFVAHWLNINVFKQDARLILEIVANAKLDAKAKSAIEAQEKGYDPGICLRKLVLISRHPGPRRSERGLGAAAFAPLSRDPVDPGESGRYPREAIFLCRLQTSR